MTNKTRVLHVRVVGFSAPERQMLNSIFLLSVAPARQIGYKLWNAENGTAPDMYLLDGDSESAVASWQAAFTNTADRTLVVGAKNTDLGVTSAARPLGLKVVSAMDRLAIALHNAAVKAARESAAQNAANNAGLDISAPSANGTLPTSPAASTMNSSAVPPPVLSASMNASLSSLNAISPNAQTLSATLSAALPASHAGTLPPAMTATPPAATVLPNVTLQPNVPLSDKVLEKTINEKSLVEKMALEKAALDKPVADKPVADKPVTEKAVDRILSEKPLFDRAAVPNMDIEKTAAEKISAAAASLMASGVKPLSPAALSAVVGTSSSTSTSSSGGSSTSSTRTNLRVVPSVSPMAASLPGASSTMSRIADAPMSPPPPVTSRIAEAPMVPPPMTPVTPAVVAAPVAATPLAAPAVATPVAVAPAAAPAATVTPPAYTPAAPTARHEEQVFRVLAVDDSPLMRTFLQNKLAPYGIQPEFAASGEEALFKISKQHFDMIFLDVMLPGMDGYDVCKMIKKNKDNHLMKVVMLTSKDKTFDKIRGTMAGCDGYLTKPVDELKLRSIIERHTVVRK